MKRSEKEIEAIFKKYFPFLVLFSMKMVGNKEDAEDIVLEVFSNSIPHFHKYDTEAQIKSLLFKATKNNSLNHISKTQIRESNNRQYSQLIGEEYEEYDKLKQVLLMHIYAHASTLPDKCQEIFFLSCCKGLRGSEIAEILGISKHTVFTQRRIALQSIRKHLNLT